MLVTIIKSADLPVHRARPPETPRLPATERVATERSLPRHLLVSLAGITAEVTALRERSADAPQTHAALGAILGKLDSLVDSIYERAANPAAPSLQRSRYAAVSPFDGPSDVPDGFDAA